MFRFVRRISGIMALLLVVFAINVSFAFGLTYQQEIGVNFTFNQSLSLTISSDIYINNLAPGTASDSNVIDVSVLTNSAYGYTLTATVGNNTTYNTRNLVHNNSNFSDIFSSINYSASPTITTNTNLSADTWAFSFSTNNGSSWSNYNGLPLYNDTTNIATLKTSNGPVASNSGDVVKFKIAAKASSAKPSGTYQNVINFALVAAPTPVSLATAYASAGATQLYGYYRMQDMTSSICSAVEVEDDQLQVIDSRDNKVYWIAKLADGNCWMTQNLDFDIDSTRTYTSSDTDLANKWVPARSTYSTNDSTWNSSSTTPESYDPGDLCWDGVVYTANGSFSDRTVPCSQGNIHYHVGNYYNWPAAVAANNMNALPDSNAGDSFSGSICPAGWELPGVRYNDVTSGSFGYLVNELGLTVGVNGNIHLSPTYFGYSGWYNGSFGSVGWYGFYWSSVTYDTNNTRAYVLSFGNGTMSSFGLDGATSRVYYGDTIRCIAKRT